MPNTEYIQQQLALLREEFANSLLKRVNQMISDLNTLQTNVNTAAVLQEIFRQIHSMSGSAGTFGFTQLSEHSRQLELIIKDFINNHTAPDAKTIDYLNNRLQNLHVLIARGPDIDVSDSSLSNSQTGPAPTQRETQRLVFIVEDDTALGQTLGHQLNHYGFKTQLFSSATEAASAIKQKKPDAMVLNITPPEESLDGVELATGLPTLLEEPVPCAFISSSGDWRTRLAAVRAGGAAYLQKPVDISVLADHLDRITLHSQREPYRVLVVDDARELGQHYALILQQAGMHAEALTEPSMVLQKIDSFKPELILLDIYFPGITGIEIAQVVRQHQNNTSIPIVFLSTETDRDIQLKTLRQGDNFLEKPIADIQLVNAVETRIDRAREFGQLMYHDGLTGLLNQITLKRRVEIEIARSNRQAVPLCYVMIDLDYFKQVNDRYGHSAGDQVLKSLSQLLKERLRKSDQIGRYGGEEFGILLPDTEADTACQIIDDLRKRFAQLSFHHGGHDFTCSFSAGIASTPAFDEANLLIEAADKALYQAKEKGRNQVQLDNRCKK